MSFLILLFFNFYARGDDACPAVDAIDYVRVICHDAVVDYDAAACFEWACCAREAVLRMFFGSRGALI